MKKHFSFEKPYIQFLAALLVFYLLTVVFFNKVIFQPNILSLSPDFLSGYVLGETSQKLAEAGPPVWSPYYFGGMPGLAALHAPLYTYTFFNSGIVKAFISAIFLSPGMEANLRLMLFHLIMAGSFTYLLARYLGMSWITAVFAGIIYMFTPQLIVLPGVGHGSKLFTAAYIPLVLLTTKRLLDKMRPLDFALFVLAVGMTLLSIHVQMAFYALLAAGIYLVWNIIFDIRIKPVRIPLKVAVFFLGVALGIGFALSSYLPVYEYTPYSIRGGTEGGLDWDYATMWSFHPLESLTYVIPSFFGFGGQTYWGYMPFTDMPLYWGAAALVCALLAVFLARNRTVTFFIILLAFAWIVSFGNFFPLLFKPMFALMPFFNKFRVPVMIQILMVMSAAMLAGFGLEKIREIAGKKDLSKNILYALIGVVGIAFVLSLLFSPFKSAVSAWIASRKLQIPPQAYGQLFSMLFGDLWKTAVFGGLTLGAVYGFLKNKIKFPVLAGGIILLLIIDLWIVNTKLVNYQPRSALDSYLQSTPAADYLRRQPGPFRIFPADRLRPQNWYGYFGLESIDGYMGTKMKRYQEIIDGVGLSNLNLINLLNTKYILSDRDLSGVPALQLVLDGQQKVFYNHSALPRAWIVHDLICLPRAEDRFAYLKSFNPAAEAIVESPVEIPPGEGGLAEVSELSPQRIIVNTTAETESFLVLSEVYYPPYWTAEIDCKETQIYPANHLLRGVVIPAGEHEVVFTCAAASVKTGKMIHTIIFIGIFLTLLAYLAPGLIKRIKKS